MQIYHVLRKPNHLWQLPFQLKITFSKAVFTIYLCNNWLKDSLTPRFGQALWCLFVFGSPQADFIFYK